MRWVLVGVVVVVAAACGGSARRAPGPLAAEPPAPRAAAAPIDVPAPRPAAVVVPLPPAGLEIGLAVGDVFPAMPPEECLEPGLRVVELDIDGDGRPDIRTLYALDGRGGQWYRCRLIDHSRDGRMDAAWVAEDAGGQSYVEYMDLDFDGRIDQAARHDGPAASVVTSRDLDGDGIVDVVDDPDAPP